MNSNNLLWNNQMGWANYINIKPELLLLITPYWAYSANISNLQCPSLKPTRKQYTIFSTKLTGLIDTVDFAQMDMGSLFTGEQPHDNKIARLLQRWDTRQFVDPPSLYLKEMSKYPLAFSDGRHRTKLAFFLGMKEIPVAIRNCDIKEIQRSGILELSIIV